MKALKIIAALLTLLFVAITELYQTIPIFGSLLILASVFYIAFTLLPRAKITDREFIYDEVKIKFNDENNIISFKFKDRSQDLLINGISFEYIRAKKSVTEPKVGSGVINGKLATWYTGDHITYYKETGRTIISVFSSGKLVGSFELPNNIADDLKAFTKIITDKASALWSEQKKIEEIAKKEKIKFEEEEKAASRELAEKKSKESIAHFISETNCLEPYFYYNYLQSNGELIWAIVADRSGLGGAIYDEGKSKWIGSWIGAEVEIGSAGLNVKIDDKEYREKFLKERRFVIPITNGSIGIEWADRIRILSKIKSN